MKPLGQDPKSCDLCPYQKRKRHQGCRCAKEKPCEERWEGSINKTRERPLKRPSRTTPWSWSSRIQNCEKIRFCCVSHPVCGVLLGQPQQATAEGDMETRAGGKAETKFLTWKMVTSSLTAGDTLPLVVLAPVTLPYTLWLALIFHCWVSDRGRAVNGMANVPGTELGDGSHFVRQC